MFLTFDIPWSYRNVFISQYTTRHIIWMQWIKKNIELTSAFQNHCLHRAMLKREQRNWWWRKSKPCSQSKEVEWKMHLWEPNPSLELAFVQVQGMVALLNIVVTTCLFDEPAVLQDNTVIQLASFLIIQDACLYKCQSYSLPAPFQLLGLSFFCRDYHETWSLYI